MTKNERLAAKRTYYQVVWKEKGMTILGAIAGPFETLKEARKAKKEELPTDFWGGPVIRKVTYEIVK